MIILVDKSKKEAALLYNNIILLPGSLEVVGIVLGHCLFGHAGTLKGKLFQKIIYTSDGEIVAKEYGQTKVISFDAAKIMEEAWLLITSIKNHNCPWINPGSKWATLSLEEFLKK
jgi:hypothetical protein